MPDPLCAFVGQGAALTAAAWAAAAANADGGGPFQRLGEGRGAGAGGRLASWPSTFAMEAFHCSYHGWLLWLFFVF